MKRIVLVPAISLISMFFSAQFASALPYNDSFNATARNFSDNYQNIPVDFRVYSSNLPSFMNLTKMKQKASEYQGISGGVSVTRADGTVNNISSWADSGHVIEFTIASTDGGFISFSPYSTDWGLLLKDIDLEPLPGETPQAVGLYIDFTNNSQELNYQLNPVLLSSVPIGVGKHPIEYHDVLYFTNTGAELNSLSLATITNNKLEINLDSLVQFESFSMQSIVSALGITNDITANPKVNTLKIGILVKGIHVEAQQVLYPGDYNCDFKVDAADYTVWRDHYGLTDAGPCSGDGDNSGSVDGGDFLIWQRNYGSVYQPPATPPAPLTAPPDTSTVVPYEPVADIINNHGDDESQESKATIPQEAGQVQDNTMPEPNPNATADTGTDNKTTDNSNLVNANNPVTKIDKNQKPKLANKPKKKNKKKKKYKHRIFPPGQKPSNKDSSGSGLIWDTIERILF